MEDDLIQCRTWLMRSYEALGEDSEENSSVALLSPASLSVILSFGVMFWSVLIICIQIWGLAILSPPPYGSVPRLVELGKKQCYSHWLKYLICFQNFLSIPSYMLQWTLLYFRNIVVTKELLVQKIITSWSQVLSCWDGGTIFKHILTSSNRKTGLL